MDSIVMNKLKKRIDWIDALKGIGIILVVLSHTTNGGEVLRTLIFSFHMPLFFMISGYLFKPNLRFVKFSFKIFKSLVIPYICCATFDLIIVACNGSFESICALLLDFLFVKGNPVINRPTWFLIILFEIELLYYFVYRLTNWKKCMLGILLFMLSFLCGRRFVFGLNIVPFSMCFFVIGDLCKNVKAYIQKKRTKLYHWYTYLIIILIWLILSMYNGPTDIYGYIHGKSSILHVVNGFLGTAVFTVIAVKLRHIRLLRYFGENSLIVLCTHYYFTRKIFFYLCSILKCEYIYENLLGQIFITLVTMIIIFCIIEIKDLFQRRFIKIVQR